MSKLVHVVVYNCLQCPYCSDCPDGSTQDKTLFARQCNLAEQRIGGDKEVKKDTPIPNWCPLPDGTNLKYHVTISIES